MLKIYFNQYKQHIKILFLIINSMCFWNVSFTQNISKYEELKYFEENRFIKKWIKEELKRDFGVYYHPEDLKDSIVLKLTNIFYNLNVLDTCRDEYEYEEAKHWFALSLKEAVPELIKKITDTSYKEMTTFYYTLNERPEALNFYDGRGITAKEYIKRSKLIDDDLFKIAGRANYILKLMTGQNFGTVKLNSSIEDLKEIQNKWIIWVRKIIKKKP